MTATTVEPLDRAGSAQVARTTPAPIPFHRLMPDFVAQDRMKQNAVLKRFRKNDRMNAFLASGRSALLGLDRVGAKSSG